MFQSRKILGYEAFLPGGKRNQGTGGKGHSSTQRGDDLQTKVLMRFPGKPVAEECPKGSSRIPQ